jgi:hypothetical protein
MSSAFLRWEEVRTTDYPDACLRCGRPDALLCRRTLIIYRHRILYRIREWVEVELPYCEQHLNRPYFDFGWPCPYDFTDKGIWMKNLSPDFCDALQEHREAADRRSRFLRDYRSGDADRDEYPRRASRSRGPLRPGAPAPSSSAWVIPVAIVSGVLVVPVLFGCLCLGLLNTKGNAGNPNNRVNRPQFQPRGPMGPQGPGPKPRPFEPRGPGRQFP